MSNTFSPEQCFLCKSTRRIVPLTFHQIYSQNGTEPLILDWWGCLACKGWFAHPVPGLNRIEQFCEVVNYNNPKRAVEIARAKEPLQRRVLAGLSRWTEPGPLLDFGCNYGDFMLMARKAGWQPSGFEPYTSAAKAARAKGFDVRCTWSLDEAGFTEASFSAITAIDVFGLVWNPIDTLYTLHCLLKPAGVLAMRLTNKRLILGLTRAFSSPGPKRDATISKILQTQFHSISVTSLSRVLRSAGFDRVRVWPHATTAPWRALGWQTRTAYLAADFLYFLSLTKINLSPGVLLFAQKAS